MEPEERDHIRKNRESLVLFTNCNPLLLSILEQRGHLSKCDLQDILYAGPPLKQAYMFYDIIVGKKSSYDDLVNALDKTTQTGAVEILRLFVRSIQSTSETPTDSKPVDSMTDDSGSSNRNLKLGSKECRITSILNDWRDSEVSATILNEWSQLARKIELNSLQIHQIRKRLQLNPEEIFEVVHDILETWTQNSKTNVTIGMLIDVLETINWNEFARLLKSRFNVV